MQSKAPHAHQQTTTPKRPRYRNANIRTTLYTCSMPKNSLDITALESLDSPHRIEIHVPSGMKYAHHLHDCPSFATIIGSPCAMALGTFIRNVPGNSDAGVYI